MRRDLSYPLVVVFTTVTLLSLAQPAYPQAESSKNSAHVTTRSGTVLTISEPEIWETGRRSFDIVRKPMPASFKQLRIQVDATALCVPWGKVASLELQAGEAHLQLVDGAQLTGTLKAWDPVGASTRKEGCSIWTWEGANSGIWLRGSALEGKAVVSGFPADYRRKFEAIRSLRAVPSAEQVSTLLVVQDDRKEVTISDPQYVTDPRDPLEYSVRLNDFPLNVDGATIKIPIDQIVAILATAGSALRLTVRLADGRELVGEGSSSLHISGVLPTQWAGLMGYLFLPVQSMARFERAAKGAASQ